MADKNLKTIRLAIAIMSRNDSHLMELSKTSNINETVPIAIPLIDIESISQKASNVVSCND